METSGEHYELAFENWLVENRISYVPVDQQHRCALIRNAVKSFDFLLYPQVGGPILAEVKGRRFIGATLEGLKNLQCWVTMEDVRGLIQWRDVISATGEPARAVFLFAYHLVNMDIETDGKEVYDFADRRYLFLAVDLDGYRSCMTCRSPRWQTVTISVQAFRDLAVPVHRLLIDKQTAGDALILG